jgi:signal transduction histidine kinase/ActR/RegA family two-component response regulator
MAERRGDPDAAGGASTHQLRLVNEQLRRSPYVLLFIDLVIAWMLMHNGASATILAWVALSLGVQLLRTRRVGRFRLNDAGDRAAQSRELDVLFFVTGLTRLWPILVAFSGAARDSDYLVTIILVGLAAGGVGTAAGLVRPYLCWAAPIALALMGGWLWRGTFEGRLTAVLLLLMFGLLALNVRSFGLTLEQLRRQIARANDERQRAEIAVLARTRFFAAASHDLRQPLGVLRWYGDAVRVHAAHLDHEPLKAIGEGIGRALEHAEPLIGKYLDIAKIEAGALELSMQPLQLARMLEEVRQSYQREAEARGLQLSARYGVEAGELRVVVDHGVLRSILDNLVGNAIKFTPAGSVTMIAELVDAPAGRLVRVSVRDTGIGIPPQEHARVFEDFYQIGNPDRSRSRGLGLGLAIVRRQAALLGTQVRLHSELDRGSTFVIDLPQAADAEHEVTGLPPRSLLAATPGVKVLVVDDEPEIRIAIQVMLEAVHWSVRTASGLEEALAELADGFAPDALIVDHRLRDGQTGIEVIDELRRSGCQAAAVIVTGDTSPEQLVSLGAAGLPVLHKPVRGDEIVSALSEEIARRAMS